MTLTCILLINDLFILITLHISISATLSRTPAQILLRWSIQRGVSVVSKSTKIERIEENSQIFDFELTANEVHYSHKLLIVIIIITTANALPNFICSKQFYSFRSPSMRLF